MARQSSRPITVARPAVGYVRVSTDEQAREGLSLAAQTARIRAHCVAQGLTLSEVVVDAGVSGKSLERPHLQALLARIQGGEVGAVVIYRLDRLTRRTRDLLELVEDVFRRHGVELVSLSEQLDTRTPAGVLTLTLLGALAQMERELIGDRTRLALAEKRARGDRLGGLPLGLQTTAPGTPAATAAAELEVVRQILGRRADGATFRAIAGELARAGRRTKRGGRWHASTVRAVCARRSLYEPLLSR